VGPTGPEGEMEQEREGGERRRKEDKEMQSGDNVGDKRKEGMGCCEKKKKTDLSLATLSYMGKIWTFYCIVASPGGRWVDVRKSDSRPLYI
jgi:hypothetical protein